MVQWHDCTIVPLFDGQTIILMIGNKTLRLWVDDLVLGYFKMFFVAYFEDKIPIFLHNFLKNSFLTYLNCLFISISYNSKTNEKFTSY